MVKSLRWTFSKYLQPGGRDVGFKLAINVWDSAIAEVKNFLLPQEKPGLTHSPMNNIATSNLLFYDLLPAKNSGRIRVVYRRNSFDGSPVIYSRKMRTDSLFLYLQNLKTILAQQWSHHFTGKCKWRTRLCCEPTQAISDNLQIVDLDLNSSVDREIRQCGLDH